MIDHLGHMNVRYYGVAARAATETVTATSAPTGTCRCATDLYTRLLPRATARRRPRGAQQRPRTGARARSGCTTSSATPRPGTWPPASSTSWRRATANGLVASWPVADGARTHGRDPRARPAPQHRPRLRPAGLGAHAGRRAGRSAPGHAPAPRRRGRRVSRPTELRPGHRRAHARLGRRTRRGRHRARCCTPARTASSSAGPRWRTGWPSTASRRRAIGSSPSAPSGHPRQDHAPGHVGLDLERGDLLVAFEVVDVALDTVSRRAVPIPDDLRAHSEARFRPELPR